MIAFSPPDLESRRDKPHYYNHSYRGKGVMKPEAVSSIGHSKTYTTGANLQIRLFVKQLVQVH
jgi:hypothetical protein